MRKKRLIIFDCDGVLRSVCWQAIYEAYLAIAEHLNCNPSDFWTNAETFRAWHNNDWHFNLERMGMPRRSDYSQITTIFHDIYDSKVQKFDWVEEVLSDLAPRHNLAVLSSAKSSSVRYSLNHSARHFDHIVGLDNVKNIKPHPEGIRLIMSLCKASAKDTIMVGDSEADVSAGKNAGVMTLGVTWGTSDFEEMKKLDPDLLFSEPAELKNL
jgi:HAD superfamily hydrolase (TIGR01549 family)